MNQGRKQETWQLLLNRIDEIDQGKSAGKTYHEIAREFGVPLSKFYLALAQARAAMGSRKPKKERPVRKKRSRTVQAGKLDIMSYIEKGIPEAIVTDYVQLRKEKGSRLQSVADANFGRALSSTILLDTGYLTPSEVMAITISADMAEVDLDWIENRIKSIGQKAFIEYILNPARIRYEIHGSTYNVDGLLKHAIKTPKKAKSIRKEYQTQRKNLDLMWFLTMGSPKLGDAIAEMFLDDMDPASRYCVGVIDEILKKDHINIPLFKIRKHLIHQFDMLRSVIPDFKPRPHPVNQINAESFQEFQLWAIRGSRGTNDSFNDFVTSLGFIGTDEDTLYVSQQVRCSVYGSTCLSSVIKRLNRFTGKRWKIVIVEVGELVSNDGDVISQGLVTRKGISFILGTSNLTVSRLRITPAENFPKWRHKIDRAYYWLKEDILEWKKSRILKFYESDPAGTLHNKITISKQVACANWGVTLPEKIILMLAISKVIIETKNENHDLKGLLPYGTVIVSAEEYATFAKVKSASTQGFGSLSSKKIKIKDSDKSYRSINFTKSVDLLYGKYRKAQIKIEFHPKFLKLLSDGQHPASYDLKTVMGLKFDSWRLFELLKSYPESWVAIDIDALKFAFGREGQATSAFMYRVLKPAISELKTILACDLSFKIIRSGNKVRQVRFMRLEI